MAPPDDDHLTIGEVEALLSTSRWSIYRLIEADELSAIDISGAQAKRPAYRIPRAALEAFLARRTVTNQD